MSYNVSILYLILFFSNIILFVETYVVGKYNLSMDYKSNKAQEKDEGKWVSFYKSNENNSKTSENKKLISNEVLDCFGIGKTFVTHLDSFLKKNSNGTKALRVKFYVNSRIYPEGVTLMNDAAFNSSNIDFDIRLRTFFIVHGFLASGTEKWVEDMKKALIEWNNVNVFIVDWSDGSNTWNYYKAAVNTRTVGDKIATFIGQLIDASIRNGIDSRSFGTLHLIGHSLGSHICGYAAQEIQKREHKWSVRRITGLDPALPCFRNTDDKLRLDQNDAPFVDIIHTNGRILSKVGLGLPFPIGDIDFYPNGGEVQPGCALSSSRFWDFLPLPVNAIRQMVCNHGRSYLYFTDSIISTIQNSCSFWSYKWNLNYDEVDSILDNGCSDRTCIEMGINAEKYILNGTFFLITGKSEPFCRTDKKSKDEVKEMILKITKETEKTVNYEYVEEVVDKALVISDWT